MQARKEDKTRDEGRGAEIQERNYKCNERKAKREKERKDRERIVIRAFFCPD